VGVPSISAIQPVQVATWIEAWTRELAADRDLNKETHLARAVADLKLEVMTPDGGKVGIITSAVVDGKREVVELAHECFANRGAAVNYLSQHREVLAERAQGWLSEGSSRPNETETRQLIRRELEQRYGDKLKRLLLTGSRARGTARIGSDWDVVAIVVGVRHQPAGPVIDPYPGPDSNRVELVTVPPEDFQHPAQYFVDMRENHVDL
jgi:predicted nucleotidyltransferase